MILNLLTTVILWVYDRIKCITAKPDYTISHQSMEYTIDSDTTAVSYTHLTLPTKA